MKPVKKLKAKVRLACKCTCQFQPLLAKRWSSSRTFQSCSSPSPLPPSSNVLWVTATLRIEVPRSTHHQLQPYNFATRVTNSPRNAKSPRCCIVRQFVPSPKGEINIPLPAALASVHHLHGDGVAIAADTVITANILSLDGTAAIVRALIHPVGTQGTDDGGIGVDGAAGSSGTTLIVRGTSAGMAGLVC